VKIKLYISDITKIPEHGLLACQRLASRIGQSLGHYEKLHEAELLTLLVSESRDEITGHLARGNTRPCFVMWANILKGEDAQRFVVGAYLTPEHIPSMVLITNKGVQNYSGSLDDLFANVTRDVVEALLRSD